MTQRSRAGSRWTGAAEAASRALSRVRAPATVASILICLLLAAGITAGQVGNPLRGKRLYVNPASDARKQADQWSRSRPADAARMRMIAGQPQAVWVGDWMRDVRAEVSAMVGASSRSGTIPVLVAYNIPYRDCGLHSAGGSRGGDAYRRWMISFAQGIGRRASVVILEPDGLPLIDCLPARLQDERYVLMREAVDVLKKAGATVYIDAGNANWKQPGDMAARLIKGGIGLADGFSLNVSNFHGTAVNIAYGEQLSRLVGGKHFVIDTSRNGRGAAVEANWCNARNQALGIPPTTQTGHNLVDAFLWVKTPGQSDGPCNGGPRAGEWWADYALELSKAAEVLTSVLPR